MIPRPGPRPGRLPQGESPYHRGSHRSLLNEMPVRRQLGTVDAIVVPTARPVGQLREAARLAKRLDCIFVGLCSKLASAEETIALASAMKIKVMAIDIPEKFAGPLPRFDTTDMLSGHEFERTTDTSLKRNLGLVLARTAGWHHIVFLDDDILVNKSDDLRYAAGLLPRHDSVALHNAGFPDNSVVCHAYRAVGGSQETFVGGGALAVSATRTTSFFPNVYNEDWLFLLGDVGLRPTAVTGKVTQKMYDPFADGRRAESEEFGDVLAEGVYSLLDDGRRVCDADIDFWTNFLEKRRRLIDEVKSRVRFLDEEFNVRVRIIASLDAAQARRALITPKICETYLGAWRADGRRWKRYLDALPTQPVEKTLIDLGLAHRTKYHRLRSAVPVEDVSRGQTVDDLVPGAGCGGQIEGEQVGQSPSQSTCTRLATS